MNKFLACQIVALVSLSFSNPAAAYFDQFALWSPFSLYPPGCTTFVVMYPGDSHVHARTEKIFSGSIPLWDTSRSIQLDVEFEIYRVGCTEPDRSIILVELNVPVTDDGIQSLVPVPHVFGQVDEIAYPLRLAREHRSYMRINEVLSESDTALFYLDNWAYAVLEMDENSYPGPMEPSQYNEKFGLIFVDSMTWNGDPVGPSFPIPRYRNQLQEPNLPWNGSLSGVWVIPDTSDQGIVVSINELDGWPDVGPAVMFVSWNTFDQHGSQLWLSGSSSFGLSTRVVDVPLVLVTDGQFLGSENAHRAVVGGLKLSTKSCTELLADYDLESLGLGSGSIVLTRLFNLETMGFTCQDHERRRLNDQVTSYGQK